MFETTRRPLSIAVTCFVDGFTCHNPLAPPVLVSMRMLPSLNQVMLPGSYCQLPRTSIGLPPSAGTTNRRALRSDVGRPTNAICLLSCDQVTSDSTPLYSI